MISLCKTKNKKVFTLSQRSSPRENVSIGTSLLEFRSYLSIKRKRTRATTEMLSIDSKTFTLVTVTVAPGGQLGYLDSCWMGIFRVLHYEPPRGHQWTRMCHWGSTFVMFSSNECLAVCVWECTLDLFSIGLWEELTDCVWEVEGRNSRGFNHVSLWSTRTHSHTQTTFNIAWADGLRRGKCPTVLCFF